MVNLLALSHCWLSKLLRREITVLVASKQTHESKHGGDNKLLNVTFVPPLVSDRRESCHNSPPSCHLHLCHRCRQAEAERHDRHHVWGKVIIFEHWSDELARSGWHTRITVMHGRYQRHLRILRAFYWLRLKNRNAPAARQYTEANGGLTSSWVQQGQFAGRNTMICLSFSISVIWLDWSIWIRFNNNAK